MGWGSCAHQVGWDSGVGVQDSGVGRIFDLIVRSSGRLYDESMLGLLYWRRANGKALFIVGWRRGSSPEGFTLPLALRASVSSRYMQPLLAKSRMLKRKPPSQVL